MPSPVRPRLLLAGALVALPLLAGCGGSKSTAPLATGPRLPVGTPAANAPDSSAQRYMAAYAAGVEGEADTLLTSNFCYHFSAQTDPTLVALYGNNWGKANETTALHHMLHGFTNSQGKYIPKAAAIAAQLVSAQVIDDVTHSDSTDYYKIVTVPVLALDVDVNTGDGTTTYNIRSTVQFYMVRGDAAVLGPGQSASPARWYLRDIDDLAAPLAGASRAPRANDPTPAASTTWGKLRGLYS